MCGGWDRPRGNEHSKACYCFVSADESHATHTPIRPWTAAVRLVKEREIIRT